MMKQKPYRIQDIDNIVLRVSKEDRLSQQRPKSNSCIELYRAEKASRSFRYLYFFYIALLGIGLLVIQFYRYSKTGFPAYTHQKTVVIAPQKTATITLIKEKKRHGISTVFRNKSKEIWNGTEISVNFPEISTSIPVDFSLPTESFHVIFIPLPKTVLSLKKISLSIKTKEVL